MEVPHDIACRIADRLLWYPQVIRAVAAASRDWYGAVHRDTRGPCCVRPDPSAWRYGLLPCWPVSPDGFCHADDVSPGSVRAVARAMHQSVRPYCIVLKWRRPRRAAEELELVSRIHGLQSLRLKTGVLTADTLDALAKCQHVWRLNLSFSRRARSDAVTQHLAAISSPPNLRELRLRQASPSLFLPGIAALRGTALCHLDLAGFVSCRFRTNGLFDMISTLPGLRYLDLSRCQIGSVAGHVPRMAGALGTLRGLRSLNLSGNPMTVRDHPWSLADALIKLHRLECLQLDGCGLDGSKTDVFATAMHSMPCLTHLALSRNLLGAALPNYHFDRMHLRKLLVHDNAADRETIEALSGQLGGVETDLEEWDTYDQRSPDYWDAKHDWRCGRRWQTW